ncbi:MAG: sn-glycerol-3-phosphate ABC transporter substrate-binding protein UgpB [SAR324 cluster bacterium]|nr:sn-glycerol-3-phosphate ABC transporter substrate-binding protein UgpB [SAR324 cluster bacterium]
MLVLQIAAALLFCAAASALQAQTKITWWHAMGGRLGEKVKAIAEGFNKSQSSYQLVPVNKGNYTETMTAGIAAFRAGKPPNIIQVFEVGTATMMAAKGAIKPVYKLMAETGAPFDPGAYLPTVTGYYTTTDGKLLSMPFNSSTPILYYNKEAFKKAGLPDRAPSTWPELVEFAQKTQRAGYPCGFTTAWQSWVQIENFSAWHDVPIATLSNGFGGLKTEFKINSPLHVRHIGNMAKWQKSKIFDYGGRRGSGQAKFTTGKDCVMYMQSSAGYAGIKRTAKFEFGTGMLPYYPDVQGAPRNSIIGGATLWVFEGHSSKEYRGVAEFFGYLSSAAVQADWHQFTGYLPITTAAYKLTKQQGFYSKNPGTETALLQMTRAKPTANSKGLRLGNFVQIRDIINNELEAVWSGKKSAKQALDDAVAQGNRLLRKFERANR